MSVFSSIMNKIFHHNPTGAQGTPAPTASPTQASTATPPVATAAAPTPTAMAAVDVDAVLTMMAADKGGGGNWRSSIVDLLKLLDLDSGLSARKELGEELGVHAGDNGSAEQNIALQKAVMQKLADNGGVVPDSLRT
jgi:hypothetical protein